MSTAPDLRDLLASNWSNRAACADYDPEWWHPDEHSQGSSGESLLLPLLICAGCPVRRECLTDALQRWRYRPGADAHPATMYASGIWGATTTSERSAARELPIDEAVFVFERTLASRVRTRVEQYRKRAAARRTRRAVLKDQRKELLRRSDADGTIDAILGDLEGREATA